MPASINKILLSLVSFLIITFGIAAQSQAPVVPEFNFYKLDKTPFTKKDLAKDKLLFFCFFDVSCDHCQHAIQKINLDYEKFTNTAIYLVTLDNPAGITNFMSHYGPNLPRAKEVTILQDLRNEFIKKFRPVKYPSIFLYSKEKKLLLYDDKPENMPKFLHQIRQSAKGM